MLEKLNVVAKFLIVATCARVRLETRDLLPLLTTHQATCKTKATKMLL